DAQQRRDYKYRETQDGRKVDGVLYPRAGTLGGCTAHNAMIFVYPHDGDWDAIATQTGDRSWRADNMRTYLARLEDCRHRSSFWRWLSRIGLNPTGHGWTGWLTTEKTLPLAALADRTLVEAMARSVAAALAEVDRPAEGLASAADPNDRGWARRNA